MNCYYCDRIRQVQPDYSASPATIDLGSAAPRCARHWRVICGKCGRPAHFMSTAWCGTSDKPFCSNCAAATELDRRALWCWSYSVRLKSPWSGTFCDPLDRMEYDGKLPPSAHQHTSNEQYLKRYPEPQLQWAMDHVPDDDELRASWNVNADRWHADYDDDGDRNRRYQSDEPMLELLGPVNGLRVLDAGCGQGYLCRKLSKLGARMTGVELSDRFFAIACEHEARLPQGIEYHNRSIADLSFLQSGSFDKAVTNYVLMDVLEYELAVSEIARVLKPGGTFVAVISHPCFSCGSGRWVAPAPDSPRAEDRSGLRVDMYFHRVPMGCVWGNFDPVLGFHRPIRDYWKVFTGAGFAVEDFEEPSITERGKRELPPERVIQALRVPYSCIFKLVKR